MSQYSYSNNSFATLARIGTGTNPRNAVMLSTAETDTVGVSLEQSASKKAVRMELVIPISRSRKGSRRAAHLSLSGRQARELYETLSRFYASRDEG